ncbi:cation transporter [Dissulfurirhabdus thermomarina]|uniref:Cation transporter n=1 Tax=Dissulfurirhabdus thermomarina TaxID=1765737 RepID=A0A6N9TNM5_DISTH|nr:cation diffusion facilitator family transporter [Dissulfurirhabdus thermomarina]NDY41693.1 cation transporter [Dissulfurirhabdus thermomarina]NMX22739.1 cation transporter [Dissulfurirhabdus thermomarina]
MEAACTEPPKDRRLREIRRVLAGVLALNLAVAAAKLGYGSLTSSLAMVADGFHSLFDGTSNVIGLLGLTLAARPPDRDHPYGHGKYQTYAAGAIGLLLLATAWKVGSGAWSRLINGSEAPQVTAASFLVMGGTVVVNAVVTLWERRAGRRLRSDILLADAGHTASDLWVSLGVIASLAAVRAGHPAADPLVGLGVAGVIFWTAFGILRECGTTLSDKARIDPDRLCDVARSVPGVLDCHSIRTRGSAAEVYVDLHVQVAPEITVADGHAVADGVERAIRTALDQVVDVVVHVEPHTPGVENRSKSRS